MPSGCEVLGLDVCGAGDTEAEACSVRGRVGRQGTTMRRRSAVEQRRGVGRIKVGKSDMLDNAKCRTLVEKPDCGLSRVGVSADRWRHCGRISNGQVSSVALAERRWLVVQAYVECPGWPS